MKVNNIKLYRDELKSFDFYKRLPNSVYKIDSNGNEYLIFYTISEEDAIKSSKKVI